METRNERVLAGVCLLMMVLLALPLHAAAARKGWTKVELAHIDGRNASAPAGLLSRFGAELIADYGTYAIVYAPKGIVAALKKDAARENIRARERDDLDLLLLPGAAVDAREGITGVPPGRLIQQYPPGKSGLYVLQLTGPARPEWLSELQRIGWKLAQYVPHDGYLAVGPPELAAQTRKLAFVQWLDFYHPYQKSASLGAGNASRDLLFVLPAGAASEEGVEAIRIAAEGSVEVYRGLLDTLVNARMNRAAALELLRHELILSVSVKPEGELADGRQVLSLSPFTNPEESQPVQGNYWNWVTGATACPDCGTMPHTAWQIGIADTGLDSGWSTFGHPDLNGRKYFGAVGYGDGEEGHDPECGGFVICDAHRHGTLVAGVAVGNNGTNAIDMAGYAKGLGGAPTAGVWMTKITSAAFGIDPTQGRLFKWTRDAANNNVAIQNHSWQAGSGAGQYTEVSRWFDIAARDSDETATANRIPLLLTVASGNDFTGDLPTSPVGMAKNVLTVGGLENYRPESNDANCRLTRGDSFRNIMSGSRTGTSLAGYIKPDVMAPASLIVSAQTSIWRPDPADPEDRYCLYPHEGDIFYSGDSGTSFAAPLGAAASLVVKRYLGSSPAATSPALTKAALIAGAHSVRGGWDRTNTESGAQQIAIGPVPSQQQGFGRLTLEDILQGNDKKPVFYDQHASRTFTAAGQKFCSRVRVRDASKPVTIALVWTDAPAQAFAVNPLVNDLNLEVRRASKPNSIHIGNSLAVAVEANGEESIAHPAAGSLSYDAVNNVEYFRSFVNANEELTISVKAWNISGDTDGNTANAEQDFALVILNATEVSAGSCDSPPVPSFTLVCNGLTCNADGSASTDDFGIASYTFNWGDSTTSTGPIASHPYAAAGSYNVTLTVVDTIGQSTTSAPKVAVVCTAAPAITQQPTSRTIDAGQSTTLTVTASLATQYQWYVGNPGNTSTPVSGGTGASVNVQPAATTNYWVRVTNSCGNTSSVAATVTVCQLPSIVQHPQNVTIPHNTSTTLTVVAGGSGPFSYQWYEGPKGDTSKPVGTNSASYTTPLLTATKQYWVRVTSTCNGSRSVDSNAATVTVTCTVAPQITQQPTSRTIDQGQQTTLTVGVNSAGTTTYQWYAGNTGNTSTPAPNGTGASLTVQPNATTNYWVRVTNNCGFVNSNTATVTVVSLQITRRQQSYALANSQNSITANWPQPTQAGNLLVAVISSDKDSAVNWTPPTGWVHAVTQEWTYIKTSIYYIPNNAGGRTSEKFTVAVGYHDQILQLFEYSGIALTNPLDRIATAGNDLNDGYIETGYTPNTVQPKELVITGLTIYAPTEFWNAANGFIELDDHSIGNHLTTAVHERITTVAGTWGHWAQVGSTAEWVGVVATFKSANPN